MTPNYLPYDELRSIAKDGDLLLWRPASLVGRAICLGTSIGKRQWIRYSHASMVAWGPNGRLYNLEMIQRYGGRHRPLSLDVAKYPKSCELWKPVNDGYDGEGAARRMLWLLGQHYGWLDFVHVGLRSLFPRMLLPKWENSPDPDQPLVCSSSFAWAARTGGGVEPCPGKNDADISPADLATSGFASYYGTPVI